MFNHPVRNRKAHGDWVQLEKTRSGLEALGFHVEVTDRSTPLARFDIIHLFNLNHLADTYVTFKRAKQAGKKIVLSSIWHPYPDLRLLYSRRFGLRNFPLERYFAARDVYYSLFGGRAFSLRCTLNFTAAAREVVTGVDVLLPNSQMEMDAMDRDLGLWVRPPFAVIPNGVDETGPISPKQRRKLIVCAGRIEPNKNQVALAKAFQAEAEKIKDYSLIFIGSAEHGGRSYKREFFGLMDGDRIQYGGMVSHERAIELFSEAAVVAQPSFFETTGLSALEALKAGAQVVATEGGFVREYLGRHAHYSKPGDIQSLQSALVHAVEKPLPPPPEEFWGRYTWAEAARLTAESYRTALA